MLLSESRLLSLGCTSLAQNIKFANKLCLLNFTYHWVSAILLPIFLLLVDCRRNQRLFSAIKPLMLLLHLGVMVIVAVVSLQSLLPSAC